MKITKGYVALVLASFGLGLAGAALTPGTATAAVEDCKTVKTNIVNRPDNGHGTGNPGAGLTGYWADVTGVRTTTVCVLAQSEVEPELAMKAELVGEVQFALYRATVSDVGTFVTRGGNTLSPNNGTKLLPGIKGDWSGGFKTIFAAPANWNNWTPGNIPATLTGDPRANGSDNNPEHDEWVRALWTGAELKSRNWTYKYGWTFVTCNEKWVNAYNNDSKNHPTAGDITGKSGKDARKCLVVTYKVQCDGKVDVTIVNKLVAGIKVKVNGAEKTLVLGTNTFTGVTTTDGWLKIEYLGRELYKERCIKPTVCATPSVTPSATPTVVPTTPPVTTAPPATTIPPVQAVAGGGGNLPVTGDSGGNPVPLFVASGTALVAIGAVMLFLVWRNRRNQLAFEAGNDEGDNATVTFDRIA